MRFTPSAMDVPISLILSITLIVIVFEMLSRMINAMIKRMPWICLVKSAAVLL